MCRFFALHGSKKCQLMLGWHAIKHEMCIRDRAKVMSQLSVSYLETGRYLTMEELRSDPGFQQLASFAAMVSDVDFMICDEEGHVLLSTDETLDGRVLTMPADMTRSIMEEGS